MNEVGESLAALDDLGLSLLPYIVGLVVSSPKYYVRFYFTFNDVNERLECQRREVTVEVSPLLSLPRSTLRLSIFIVAAK